MAASWQQVREKIDAVNGALDGVLDYWVAVWVRKEPGLTMCMNGLGAQAKEVHRLLGTAIDLDSESDQAYALGALWLSLLERVRERLQAEQVADIQ